MSPDNLGQISFRIDWDSFSAPIDQVWKNETERITHEGQKPAVSNCGRPSSGEMPKVMGRISDCVYAQSVTSSEFGS